MTPFHPNVTPLRPVGPPLRRQVTEGTQGTLALDIGPDLAPPGLPGGPSVPPPRRPTAPGADVVPIDIALRRQLQAWGRRYCQAAVEIVNGDRPVSQLVRWSSARVREELTRRALIVSRAGVHQAGLGHGRRPMVRPQVRSVHPSFLSPGVVEASVHVQYGDRSRALAARFELVEQRWICTALAFA